MKIYNWDLKKKILIQDKLIMCLGSFESLHIGHYELFKLAKSYKNENDDFKMAIIIFSNPIKNGKIIEKKLFQLKTRLYTLDDLKFDYVFIIETDDDVINISAEKFIDKLKELNTKVIVCGPDYKFGFNKIGNIDLLKKNFISYISNERKVKKTKVSTQIIKQLISEGNINYANELLLQKYSVIIKADKFIFQLPEKIIKIKPGIYVINAIIKNVEYHGICMISKYSTDNKLYLLDILTIPSKHEEIYLEFLATIRYIETKNEDNITDEDLKISKRYFEELQ